MTNRIKPLPFHQLSDEEMEYWKKKEPWNYMRDYAHEQNKRNRAEKAADN